ADHFRQLATTTIKALHFGPFVAQAGMPSIIKVVHFECMQPGADHSGYGERPVRQNTLSVDAS
ncbi:hypothetical protein, partial [Mycobacteroides chelonae]|uniref:hypothetical protein n=1 Tax=Mycobacteroides chelonae TaxID=1774 RepID=UPI0013F4D1DD